MRLYLRPEDRVLADSGPVESLPNALSGIVRHVDFLGTYCLASLDVDGFDGQRMLVYFSLNQTHELGVREGARVPFALRGERVRVFAAMSTLGVGRRRPRQRSPLSAALAAAESAGRRAAGLSLRRRRGCSCS